MPLCFRKAVLLTWKSLCEAFLNSRGYFPRFSFSTVSMVFYTYIIHSKILPCFSQFFHTFLLERAYDETPDIKSELEDLHLCMLSLVGYLAPAVRESLLSKSYVHGRTVHAGVLRDQHGA